MSGDEPVLEWQQGDTLGRHHNVQILCRVKLAARDQVAFVTVHVSDPNPPGTTLLYWQDDLTTNLNNSDGLLEQLEAAVTGAMGYLTPMV